MHSNIQTFPRRVLSLGCGELNWQRQVSDEVSALRERLLNQLPRDVAMSRDRFCKVFRVQRTD